MRSLSMATLFLIPLATGCMTEPGAGDEPEGETSSELMACPTGAICEPVDTPITQHLIVNEGFESGTTAWNLSGTARVDSLNCRTGTKCMHLGGIPYTSITSGQGYQTVTIPVDSVSATLSFDLYVFSYYTQNDPDIVTVLITDTQGHELMRLASLYPSSLYQLMSTGWNHFGSYNLMSLRGRTVRVAFQHASISGSGSAWGVDNVDLTIKRWP